MPSGAIWSYLELCGAICAIWGRLDFDFFIASCLCMVCDSPHPHVLRQVFSGPPTSPTRIGGPRFLSGLSVVSDNIVRHVSVYV